MTQLIIEKVHKKLKGEVSTACIEAVLEAAGHFELLDRTRRMCFRMYEEQSKLETHLRKLGVPM